MDFSNNDYFSNPTSDNAFIDSTLPEPEERESVDFTTKEIGTTTIPFGDALNHPEGGLKAKIKQGVGRIEFSFLGQGKGSSQQPTPSDYGKGQRTDMRELLKINNMKTATHASVHTNSLAGLDMQRGRGFNDGARANVLKEIKRAIDFASEATKGGAIVFHFHEWNRGLSDLNKIDSEGGEFTGYEKEDEKTPLLLVNEKTGDLTQALTKDQTIKRLKYKTAADIGRAGKKDAYGNILAAEDWVDMDGNRIDAIKNPDRLQERVPLYDPKTREFQTEDLTWDKVDAETKRYNSLTGQNIAPEEYFVKQELQKQIGKARGMALYYQAEYDKLERAYESKKELKQKYETLKNDLKKSGRESEADFWLAQKLQIDPKNLSSDFDGASLLDEDIANTQDRLKQVYQSSGDAQIQANTIKDDIDKYKTVEDYGIKRTAQTVAEAAMYAREKWLTNKDKYGLEDPIYVAPENYDVNNYGSHPDEYRKAIDASRQEMIRRLKQKNYSEDKAKQIAKQHIKGTLDIGHLNMYRNYFKKKNENESEEETNKRFNEWMLKQTKKLLDDGYVGHVHVSDNYGFDDDHLSPGQGNTPIREFLKQAKEAGLDDVIVETGSFNPMTGLYDTLEYINSPIYGKGQAERFKHARGRQSGQNNPGFFIAGAYAPSNEWKLWSDVPLE